MEYTSASNPAASGWFPAHMTAVVSPLGRNYNLLSPMCPYAMGPPGSVPMDSLICIAWVERNENFLKPVTHIGIANPMGQVC